MYGSQARLVSMSQSVESTLAINRVEPKIRTIRMNFTDSDCELFTANPNRSSTRRGLYD